MISWSVCEPTSRQLQRVKARLSTSSWDKRVEQARQDKGVVEKILAKSSRGSSLNRAIASEVPVSQRSWAYRRIPRYRTQGFEGLIDARTPREPTVSLGCREVLQGARQANPHLTVGEAEAILKVHGVERLPSETTIKREFACADAKRREAQKRGVAPAEAGVDVEQVELAYAGGELLLAAEAETGGIAALTAHVVKASEETRAASQGQRPKKDVARRSSHGRFTASYNRARRRKPGEVIASYLRSSEEKAQGRVLSSLRFVHESAGAIHGKLSMLAFCSVMEGTTGWGALRSADMAGLGPLVGYAYMPSTLAKLLSGTAVVGLGPGLLETVGSHWHEVAQARWGEPGAMAALYLDNHAKEVWSTLFTKAGKVSHRTRVMPCITSTYAHTGAGTPLVMSVQSGSAPLAPRLVDLVDHAETTLGGVVRRAVVIDSEGSTFDILASFDVAKRVIVTPLKPSRAPELELVYSRGSYYRPYRENDELRVATCTLRHKSTNRTLELGALLIRRPHRDNDIVLLTTGLRLGFEGRDLADLYFRRWPVQENSFKQGVIVGLNRHRGICGRMVANVAVVTELEQLEQRAKRDTEARAKLEGEAEALAQAALEAHEESERTQSRLSTRRRRLDDLVAQDKTAGRAFARAAVEHQQVLARSEACAAADEDAKNALHKNEEGLGTLASRIEKTEARVKELEPQRTIRQLDVAQDMVLTAIKLTAAQLITFALREYLPSMPMVVETFIKRVFSIKGHKEVGRAEERVMFYENPRDPQVMEALRDACRRLNERNLTRDGRRMRYEVVAPPERPADWFG